MFFVAPLLPLLWVSFHSASDTELYGPALTTAHYAAILTDPFYHTIILRTLSTGAVILLLCLVLGYATAYVIVPLPPGRCLLLMALLVLPLMVSNVVRAYGWIAILGRQGLVNSLLRDAGGPPRGRRPDRRVLGAVSAICGPQGGTACAVLAASPLPASPTRGEVPLGAFGTTERPTLPDTLPLVGRAGEGEGHKRQPIGSRPYLGRSSVVPPRRSSI